MTPEEKLSAIKAILWPAPIKRGDRSETIFDADENLDAALYDLKRTMADKVCINTVEDVVRRLYDARKVMEAQ